MPCGTPWHDDDRALVAAAVAAGARAAWCCPRPSAPQDLASLAARSAPKAVLVPLIESAAGLDALDALAAAPQVLRLAFGHLDFQADLGMACEADEAELVPVRLALVLASRRAGLAAPIDGVSPDWRDRERLAADARAPGAAASAPSSASTRRRSRRCTRPSARAPSKLAWARRVHRRAAGRGRRRHQPRRPHGRCARAWRPSAMRAGGATRLRRDCPDTRSTTQGDKDMKIENQSLAAGGSLGAALWALQAPAAAQARLARQAHHDGRAVLGRRPDRRGGAPARDPDGQVARPDGDRREHGGRRRHHRARARGEGAAQRLHHPDPPHGHGHRAGALQEAAVRPAEGLRVHRPGDGRADDAAVAQGLPGQQLPGTAGLREGQQGQGLARQRRRGRGVAAVRPAVREPDRRAT